MKARQFKESKVSASSSSSSQLLTDYIQQLEAQCGIRTNAVKIAEELITAYRVENQNLKAQNKIMKQLVLEKKGSINQDFSKQCKELEKKLYQQSQRMRQLLQKNLFYQKKITQLQRKLRNFNKNSSDANKSMKSSRKKRQCTQASEQPSNNLIEDIKMMREQEKQKDEIIVHLLKKLNYKEEEIKAQNSRKMNEKSDFYQTASSLTPRLSKKFNSSLQSLEL